MRTSWMLVMLGACGAGQPQPAAVAVSATADAAPADAGAEIDAGWVADEDVVSAVRLVAKRRVEEVLAERATGWADGGEMWIDALGECERPGAAEREALTRRVDAFIARAEPRARREPGAIWSVWFGCEEAGGIVIDAQADLTIGRRRFGRWWTLRVTPKAIGVLAETSGCAIDDCMEWSDVASVRTFVLADLGRGREPIVLRDRHEGGAAPRLAVLVGKTVVGRVEGGLGLPPLQPPPAEHTVVVSVDATDGSHVYRCITARGPWSLCPAAVAQHDRERALAAGEQLLASPTALLDDREALADALDAIGIAAADAAPWLAAARPSTLAGEVRAFLARRAAPASRLTVEEREAARVALSRRASAEVLAAVGHAPCPPIGAAALRAAEARLARWVRARDKEASAITVLTACVAGPHAYGLVQWHDERAAVARRALVHTHGARTTALVEGSAPLEHGEDGAYPADLYQLPEAKLHLQGTTAAALVRGPGDRLTAIVDGRVTGTLTDVHAELWWHDLGPAGELLDLSHDSLARGYDAEENATVYWQATADGPRPLATFSPIDLTAPPSQTAPAAAWLERSERRRRAEAVLGISPHPGQSDAEVRAALDELRLTR